MTIKTKGLLTVLTAYVIAVILGFLSLKFSSNLSSMMQILIADIVATFVIYAFSVYFKNSSFYDPYWSVIPPFIAFFWLAKSNYVINTPSILLMTAVLFWSLRLTYNWMKTWDGLHHEDWRYIDMRNNLGNSFEIMGNLGGIHFFPTFIVFFCCMPMAQNFSQSYNWTIFIGFGLCIIGVLLEIISDKQLHAFRKIYPSGTGIIETGLWNYSRHPNYYGEIMFWWGIFVFGYSFAGLNYLLLAPIAMTAMFWYASIPWIEIKILRTRPQYENYQKRVHILFPEITILKRLFKG
jgi:steroid 5-alpha reductase family enzyme